MSDDDLLTVGDAVELARGVIGAAGIRHAVARGRLTVSRRTKRGILLFEKSEVERFLRNRKK